MGRIGPGTRLYIAGAALVTLGLLLHAAQRGGYVRLPWGVAPEAGLQSSILHPARTVDLESGKQGSFRADLLWGLQARNQPYLSAIRRESGKSALIAEVGVARWEDLDAAALAKLSYAANQYAAWGPDAPVRPGAVFAVRTLEGNLAKLRVTGINRRNEMRLEWVLFKEEKIEAEETTPPAAIASAASLAWQDARDEALIHYKAQRYQAALESCGRAVESAEKAGAAQHAAALVGCGGLIDLHQRASKQMEAWLRQGAALAATLEPRAIAALGPREAMLQERALRMLGVFYRDQNRPREAVDAFARAVDAVRALPPPETAEHRLALRGDLYELGGALARLGLRGTARQALGESRELYLKTEPAHPALKSIEAQLQKLQDPEPEPAK